MSTIAASACIRRIGAGRFRFGNCWRIMWSATVRPSCSVARRCLPPEGLTRGSRGARMRIWCCASLTEAPTRYARFPKSSPCTGATPVRCRGIGGRCAGIGIALEKCRGLAPAETAAAERRAALRSRGLHSRLAKLAGAGRVFIRRCAPVFHSSWPGGGWRGFTGNVLRADAEPGG